MIRQNTWEHPEIVRLFEQAADQGIVTAPDRPERDGASFSVLFTPETHRDVLQPLPKFIAQLRHYTTEFSTMTPRAQRLAANRNAVYLNFTPRSTLSGSPRPAPFWTPMFAGALAVTVGAGLWIVLTTRGFMGWSSAVGGAGASRTTAGTASSSSRRLYPTPMRRRTR